MKARMKLHLTLFFLSSLIGSAPALAVLYSTGASPTPAPTPCAVPAVIQSDTGGTTTPTLPATCSALEMKAGETVKIDKYGNSCKIISADSSLGHDMVFVPLDFQKEWDGTGQGPETKKSVGFIPFAPHGIRMSDCSANTKCNCTVVKSHEFEGTHCSTMSHLLWAKDEADCTRRGNLIDDGDQGSCGGGSSTFDSTLPYNPAEPSCGPDPGCYANQITATDKVTGVSGSRLLGTYATSTDCTSNVVSCASYQSDQSPLQYICSAGSSSSCSHVTGSICLGTPADACATSGACCYAPSSNVVCENNVGTSCTKTGALIDGGKCYTRKADGSADFTKYQGVQKLVCGDTTDATAVGVTCGNPPDPCTTSGACCYASPDILPTYGCASAAAPGSACSKQGATIAVAKCYADSSMTGSIMTGTYNTQMTCMVAADAPFGCGTTCTKTGDALPDTPAPNTCNQLMGAWTKPWGETTADSACCSGQKQNYSTDWTDFGFNPINPTTYCTATGKAQFLGATMTKHWKCVP